MWPLMNSITRTFGEIQGMVPLFIVYFTEDGEIIRVIHEDGIALKFNKGDNFWKLMTPSAALLVKERLRRSKKSPVNKIVEIGEPDKKYWFDCKFANRLYRGQTVISAVGMEIDSIMSKVEEYQKQVTTLKQMAYKDPLTELLNRRGFWQAINKKRIYASENNLAVILVDIDNLKKLNSDGGHDFGDQQIELIANTIKDSLRTTDFVARFGGDELVILLNQPKGKPLDSEVVAKRIIRNISEDNKIETTVTMGVVDANWGELQTHSHEHAIKFIEGLITEADKKLMRGKTVSKNSYYK